MPSKKFVAGRTIAAANFQNNRENLVNHTDTARVVGPETVRMLELGHPWVVADAYTRKWPAGRAGDTVELCSPKGDFLATALLDPQERIVARVLDRKRIRFDHAWLKRRLQDAVGLRLRQADLDGTTAYRLVNGEGDGLPGLTVDHYADYLMVQLYSAAWRPHLKLITQVLQEVASPLGIYEKSRPQKTRELEAAGDSKNYGRLLTGKAAPQRLEVLENGLRRHSKLA